MESYNIVLIVGVVACVIRGNYGEPDLPCAARQIPGESVVCVCNATYCDTLTRPRLLAKDTFMTYTSSQRGLRFHKTSGSLLYCPNKTSCSPATLTLDLKTRFQSIQGFGGAATDSAGINWKNLSLPLQEHLVNSYFSNSGIEYSVVRVPVGGCDFSTRPYAYNEQPFNDAQLSNYSLSAEDYNYKIPLIRAGMAVSSTPLHVVATVWSPPPWMKTNNQFSGYSQLKPEYFETYADYYYKFIERYAVAGINVWGITTTNEPTNGVIPANYFNSLGWTADTLGYWIVNHLGPKIRNSTFPDVKIIAGDDQRATLWYWINMMLEAQPRALQYIDGVAVHYYTDFFTPAALLTHVMQKIPNKFLLATEACEGSFPWQLQKVKLGSWQRAFNYISDIITDLNHNAVGWIDWNLCLNSHGGPNWAGNFVDSPIIVFPERDEFIKEPMFYAIGHFSKFIPRRSRRVLVVENRSLFSSSLEHVAFLTPRKTVVIVFYNNGAARTVSIKVMNKIAVVRPEEKSVTTVEIPVLSSHDRNQF